MINRRCAKENEGNALVTLLAPYARSRGTRYPTNEKGLSELRILSMTLRKRKGQRTPGDRFELVDEFLRRITVFFLYHESI